MRLRAGELLPLLIVVHVVAGVFAAGNLVMIPVGIVVLRHVSPLPVSAVNGGVMRGGTAAVENWRGRPTRTPSDSEAKKGPNASHLREQRRIFDEANGR